MSRLIDAKYETVLQFIAGSVGEPRNNMLIEVLGYYEAGDGGAGSWKHNGVTGQTVSQSPAQLGLPLLNDANGNQWALVINKQLFMSKVGLMTGQDNYAIFKIELPFPLSQYKHRDVCSSCTIILRLGKKQ